MSSDQTVYRPPMEQDSLIVQVTSGCAHNKCTFCTMYRDRKFQIRKMTDIIQALNRARKVYANVEKIFLADGDALVLDTQSLLEILKNIKAIFPECTHVASYARMSDVLRKNAQELKTLHENGLKKLYLGLESGSGEVLTFVNKNSSPDDAVMASKLLKEAGIITYVTVLLGLGGKRLSNEHVERTAEILNIMKPDYISLMTLLVSEDMPLMNDVKNQNFELLSPQELVEEGLSLLQMLELESTFLRINHASNFVNIEGKLSVDKECIITDLKRALDKDLDVLDNYRRF